MPNQSRLFIATVLCCIVLSNSVSASVVYSLQNNAAVQNNHSLSGSITVSDTAAADGLLAVSEIEAFSIIMKNSGDSVVASHSASAPFSDEINLLGSVSISPTAITLGSAVAPTNNQLLLGRDLSNVSGLNGMNVTWLRRHNSTDIYFGSYGENNATQVFEWFEQDPAGGVGGDPWVIAVIPEPASIALLAIGGVMLLRRRQRIPSQIQTFM